MPVQNSLGNIAHLLRLAFILARHDALFPLEAAGVPASLLTLLRLAAIGKRRRRPGQRLAEALQHMGPAFIKLGQTLATRSDLLGEEMAADLALLQDRLPPFPGKQARAILEAELGGPRDAFFRDFADTAQAAASIAQVHMALTREGEPVAVKVLRPNIEKAFARDIELLDWLAGWAEKTRPALRRLKPREVVATLERSVHLEMDLRMEAAAAAELRQNFSGDPDFRVPAINWALTSRRVLTSERIEGIRIDDRAALVAAGHDPDAILAKSSAIFFRQVFRDGFFHADLHPGNLFVDEKGRIAAVDFGIMGRLEKKTRNYVADILLGFLNADYAGVAKVHFRAGYVPAGQSLDDFTLACRAIGEPILGRPMHEISVARLLSQLFQVTEEFQMETQPQLLLLQKTMLVAEGVGRMLNPSVNMWTLARPLIEGWMRDNRGVEARLGEAARGLMETAERLPVLLRNLEEALRQTAEGGIKLHPSTIAALRGGSAGRARFSWAGLIALVIAILLATLHFTSN